MEKTFEELQIYEQNLQSIMLQKQILQAELNEIINALDELEKLGEDSAFRIVGGIMVKKKKEELQKELEERKKIVELRIKNFEKHEELLKKKAEELRQELLKTKKS